MERGVVVDDELWGTDAAVWKHLHECDDPEVVRWVRLAEGRPEFVADTVHPTIRIKPKVRAIDPDVATGDGLRPLSAIDADFRERREEYVRRKSEGLSVRLLD